MFSKFFSPAKFTSPRRKESPVSVLSTPELAPEEMISLRLNLKDATPPVGINTENLKNEANLALSKRDFVTDLQRGIKIRYDFDGEIVAPKFSTTDTHEELFDEIDAMCGDGAKVVYRCAQGSQETPAFGNHFIYGIYYLFMLSGISLSNKNNVNNGVNMTVICSKEHETVKFQEKFSYGRILIGSKKETGSVSMDSTQVIDYDGNYHDQSVQELVLTLPKKVYVHVKTFLEEKYAERQDSSITFSSLLGMTQENAEKYQVDLFAEALKNASEVLAKPLSASSLVAPAPTTDLTLSSSSVQQSSMVHRFTQSLPTISDLFKAISLDAPKQPSTPQVPSAQPPLEFATLASCSEESRQESRQESLENAKPSTSVPNISGMMY